MNPTIACLGTFNTIRRSVAFGTVFVVLVPPNLHCGNLPSGKKSTGRAKVTKVIYTTGAATHLLTLLRPFNYTTFSADAAAGQAVVNITADPGLYSTAANWLYPPVPGGTPRVADNAIAANDYIVYQCADGTYVVDTVASVSTLAITMTANVPTGGVKAGGLFYFYGVVIDSDPNTAQLNPQTTMAASLTRDASWADQVGVAGALHDGDPMILYSANGTATGLLEGCCGYYGKY